MINDLHYWNAFYKHFTLRCPSPFAIWCQTNWLSKHAYHIADVGCGNGRDSCYFYQNGHNVLAIDSCSESRNLVSSLSSLGSPQKLGYINFECMNCLEIKGSFDCVYSRWLLHAIDQETEDAFLSLTRNILEPNGMLMFEFRTTIDNRRAVNIENVTRKLSSLGMLIIHESCEKGRSVMEGDDPILGRVVAIVEGQK